MAQLYFLTKIPLFTFFKVFQGNFDRYVIVSHDLAPPIRAKYIRFHPKTCYGNNAMRVEIYGCYYGGGK